jgi:hypothetical protein
VRFVFLLAGLMAIAPLQRHIDGILGEFKEQEAVLLSWSGPTMKKLVPGFEGPVADLFWLRTVQYYGGQRVFAAGKKFDLVAPLVDVTVTLDPRMEVAYRLGAIFLSESPPAGAGRPSEGARLMRRGIAANPTNWRLAYEAGVFEADFLGEYASASKTLLRASTIPGSGPWLKSVAALFLLKGGDRETSRAVWREIYENSREEFMKRSAERRLRGLDSLDRRDRVIEALSAYRKAFGHYPATLRDLVQAGFKVKTLDLADVPFVYDAKTGVVDVSSTSPVYQAGH